MHNIGFPAGLIQWPAPGVVVSIPTHLFYRHKGIVSDRLSGGKPMVISNSARRGGVYEESWDQFSEGQQVSSEGYPGTLPYYEVIARAHEKIGSRYNVFNWNCDSLANYAHGLPTQSPQLALTLLLLGVGLAVTLAARG
jgi:hypothetical protein